MLGGTLSVSAQTIHRLPGQHQVQHGDLLANQGHSNIHVDNTSKYLESLFEEEEELFEEEEGEFEEEFIEEEEYSDYYN